MEGKKTYPSSQTPIYFLRRALGLASLGRGNVSPNPLVGAVLVKGGQIIGEGYHQRYGEKHAEALAIEEAIRRGNSPAGADLYCTLEPCCFSGPTKHQPPCADLIVRSGISRVFLCTLDPHPLVRGRGVQLLEKAGIPVSVGFLQKEALDLNRGFFTYHVLNRPFVHLKIAQSVDGRVATREGDSRWITDERARRLVHKWRASYDAVLVGKHTVRVDDPELTVRLVQGRNPYRIVLDSRLELPLSRRIFNLPDPERTIVVTGEPILNAEKEAITQKRRALNALGVRVLSVSPSLPALLQRLGELGIRSVLVEGGASVFTSFLKENIFDRITFFIAPFALGKGIEGVGDLGIRKVADHVSFERIRIKRIGNQVAVDGYRMGFHASLLGTVATPRRINLIVPEILNARR